MSLESSIAALTQQAGLLMDLPAQVNAAAQVQIAAMGAAYQGHIAGLAVTAYVDQVNGLDTNSGAIDSPFRTIGKALSLTPRGGVCSVLLKGPYLMDQTIIVDGRRLHLQSANSVRHALSFARFSDMFGTATLYRGLHGFRLQLGASISFRDLTLVMPALDGTWGSQPLAGSRTGMVGVDGSGSFPVGDVLFGYCDITLPATPFSPLLGIGGSPLLLNAFTLTSTNPLNGKWFEIVTASGGTATTTLPWLTTNLATV